MKKLLVGLLALGSFSVFAQRVSNEFSNEVFDRPCIAINNNKEGVCFHKRSNMNKLCELMTGQAGSIARSYVINKRMFGANAITSNGIGYNQNLRVAVLDKNGRMKTLNMYSSGGTPVVDTIDCTLRL